LRQRSIFTAKEYERLTVGVAGKANHPANQNRVVAGVMPCLGFALEHRERIG